MDSSTVNVRLFAAARAAAGVAEVAMTVGTVAELRERLGKDFGPELVRVLQVSSVLVDGISASDDLVPLSEGATVDILPPFAGG